jgi:hypothetical protein
MSKKKSNAEAQRTQRKQDGAKREPAGSRDCRPVSLRGSGVIQIPEPNFYLQRKLPVSATMSAATVRCAASEEAAAAVETAAASEAIAAREAAARLSAAESITDRSARRDTLSSVEAGARCNVVATVEAAAIIKAATVVEATAIIKAAPEAITVAEAAAEPRAGADEDSAVKPIGAVETVRRTGVGVIIIVAVRADRGGAIISAIVARANSDADTYAKPLSAGVRR